ncbi:MAG: single-stranded DNA-binding protein [Coriobacteriia bacterium]|jgi:spoIIIJ-associated protein|uniref:Jag family protein n=1 Tax=Paratractidigestivibacter sp. TaxID=2847316 RepID=UPI000D7AE71B|nr:MAG: single-stranded DNA-binding protein [Coriobacteriia bacterium]
MDDEVLTVEETSADQSLTTDAADEFSSIRERFEAGAELTEEETDKVADVAVEYLRELLGFFGETSCSIDEYDGDNGELILDVNGGDLAVLIGRHGRTLDALQMVLSSLMSSTLKFYYPIVVDIESYKSRRKSKVQGLARAAAAKARKQGRVAMAPMNAYERRLVHLALHDDDSVTTHSEGEDPNRRVVITAVH